MTHRVAYNGKVVEITNADPKREFHLACVRPTDNGAEGYVLDPKGRVYFVKPSSRKAFLVTGPEREQALALFE